VGIVGVEFDGMVPLTPLWEGIKGLFAEDVFKPM
jgi:hypothetical protein